MRSVRSRDIFGKIAKSKLVMRDRAARIHQCVLTLLLDSSSFGVLLDHYDSNKQTTKKALLQPFECKE